MRKKPTVGINASIVVELNGEEINLTSYVVTENGPYWVHTDSSEIEKILEHVQSLVNQITSSQVDVDDPNAVASITKDIARVHWWMAHAAPFRRGSAAITEWVIQGLFQFHKLEVEWSAMVDCKALIQPDIEQYVLRYKEFSKVNIVRPDSAKHGVLFPSQDKTVFSTASPSNTGEAPSVSIHVDSTHSNKKPATTAQHSESEERQKPDSPQKDPKNNPGPHFRRSGLG